MSRTLNRVMLIGNVGRDPELKFTPSGIPVTTFRLATSETWRDRDGNLREHTDWHSIVACRGLAEIIHKIIRKGSRIYIEGKIQTRTFYDKSGSNHHIVEVLADNMLNLDLHKANEYEDYYEGKSHIHGPTEEYSIDSEIQFDDISFLEEN